MQFWRSRRGWLVGGLLGYALLILAFSAVSGALAQSLSANGQNTIAAPFTKPTYSSPIALSQDNSLVWVVNPDDDSVSVISTATNQKVANNISVGDEPQSIALDPNNQFAYVANAAGNSVSIIEILNSSPTSFSARELTELTTGAEPWNIVISPNGQRVYVANSAQDTITVINAQNRTIIGNVDLRSSACNSGDANRHFQPRGLAVTLDNTRLYVTRFLSFTRPGGVQATNDGKVGLVCRLNIDTAATTIGGSVTGFTPITLAAQPSGFPPNVNEPAYPNQLQSIVIRGDKAYLPNIAAAPAPPLAFNADTQAFVNRIDGISGTEADGGAINLHLGARDPEPGKTKLFFANPWAIAFTNQSGAGNAYVVSAGSDLLVKLNVGVDGALSFTVDDNTTRYIDLHDPANPATSDANAAKNPLGIVINDAGTTAYVMNYVSRNVSVVDLASDSVTKVIRTTELPPPGTLDETLQVGKEIFFSSRGVFNGGKVNRLSSEGWQNCASCHFAGLTDGNIWSFAAGPRKSVPMAGTWSPHNPDDQRLLNYSAIFDEVQDFEINIRNVSGPGNLPNTNPPQLDPNHGLLIGDNGDINAAPGVVNAFAVPNAGRPQLTVTLPGSNVAVPALDAMKEWVRFGIRTPNGALTTQELTAGGGNATGGLNPTDVRDGRRLFFRARCQTCHGGTKWTISNRDFTPPPPGADIATETNPAPPASVNPVGAQYLFEALRDIGSFNLGVVGGGNPIGANVGAAEKAANGQDALGKDHNGDGKGNGFNIPSLLGIWQLPPYYHNGACETLACVLSNQAHRTAKGAFPDVLANPADQAKVVAFLQSLDADTEFPTNLYIVRHDIFFDPPAVIAGTTVEVGANISLFGTRQDLTDLLGSTPLKVKFTGPGLNTEVDVPASAFAADFGQATVKVPWNVPNAVGVQTIVVQVDSGNVLAEANENDNTAGRRVFVRPTPPDTTPPTVSNVRISDDEPFNENDAIVTSGNVQVRFQATDADSGLDSYCIVRYSYSSVLRRWVEENCVFRTLPAPDSGTSDTFTVDTSLPPKEGAVYAFVWVKDKAGNISRRPGFDVASFIPTDTDIELDRNEVRVFRITLGPGQSASFTFTPVLGDVDVSVFNGFGANATRCAVSANNGTTPETVTIGAGACTGTSFQIEVRAVVNSTIQIAFTQTLAGLLNATPDAIAPAKELPLTPIVAGPPAEQAAIEGGPDVLLPIVVR